MSQFTKAALVSLTLGITTIATTLGTIKQASALPLLDVLQVPLNAVLGRPQPPQPPTRTTDLQVMNGNLNGNNLTLCTLTCGLPGLPGNSAPARPVGAPPPGVAPNGLPVGLPPGAFPPGALPPGAPVGLPPGARPPVATPVANQTQPSLLLPPIPLPNPFN